VPIYHCGRVGRFFVAFLKDTCERPFAGPMPATFASNDATDGGASCLGRAALRGILSAGLANRFVGLKSDA